MKISENLLCLFTAQIDSRQGEVVITVPENELEIGNLEPDENYRVAIFSAATESESQSTTQDSRPEQAPVEQGPPVTEGDQIEVEIEDLGEQGDGIARVGPGYIVFIPDTQIGDRVNIEIIQAQENFAIADVVEKEPIS